MKKPLFLAFAILYPASSLTGQTIVGSNSFFDPDFKVRRNGTPYGVLNVTVNNTPVTQTGSAGNSFWSHSAGGFAQAGSHLAPLGIPLANVDVQLAATSRTTGNTLVFGREITNTTQLLGGAIDLGNEVQGLVNQVAGASVLYNWDSTATISGLSIVPDQLYQVNFTATSGAGLPVDILQAATFGINTPGISSNANESMQLLNLLDLVHVGNSSSTGNFSFYFKSNQNRSSLDFNFAATTGVGVSLLGGTANNQNVLTFSGFQVAAVPEPGTIVMCGSMLCFLTFRRQRRKASETPTPCES